MTPDQIAEFCGHATRRGEECICALLELFGRAALLERDAAWAAAVKASGLMLSPDSDNEAWQSLRALLEEAGK